jgi:nucleoside-diphosphate-sugar epimerase
MDILVLGGTYFLGKAFLEMLFNKCTKTGIDYRVSLINRGSKALALSDAECRELHVKEYHMDRHDKEKFEKMPQKSFDVVVDFCGYEKRDIELLFEAGLSVKQYVFVSTVDVYSREDGDVVRNEDYPYETRHFAGPVGDYISGKVFLEQELKALAGKTGFKYTIIRPAVIYGPANYAERENMYFKWMVNAGQILSPVDATGYFQMVYVKDVAEIICSTLLNELSFDKAYNVCTNKKITYSDFVQVLKKVGKTVLDKDIQDVEITTDTVLERQLPLPFPLFEEESFFYDGSRSKELGVKYMDLYEGLCESLRAYILRM